MSLGLDVAQEIFRRGGGAIGMTARVIGFGRKAMKGVVGLIRKAPQARPGIGSAVTKGPLKIGKTVVFGAKTGISTAAKVAIAAGVGAGVATGSRYVASLQSRIAKTPVIRRAAAPAPQAAPRRAAVPSGNQKCCPPGTKRVVCFKRGKVKKESRATERARAARLKQRARNQKAKEKAKARAAAKRNKASVRKARKFLKRVTRRR